MPPRGARVSDVTPVVYSCCSVAVEGRITDPCWMCGHSTGRDAWTDTSPGDYDGYAARRYITIEGTQ